MLRLGRTVMVMGLGTDAAGVVLLGASIVEQIEATKELDPQERRAQLMVILGNALFQAGIGAGGELAGLGLRRRMTVRPPGAGRSSTTLPDPKGTTVRPRDGDERLAPEARDDPLAEALKEPGIRRDLQAPAPQGPGVRITDNMTLPERFSDWKSAYDAYNRTLNAAGGREVAIFWHTKQRRYVVQVGTRTSVGAPAGGPWRALLHFHPTPSGVLTFRLPSGADFDALITRLHTEGRSVRELIEFDVEGVGRGRTEFGITMGAERPFYVKTHLPDGSVSELRFKDAEDFAAHWGSEKIYVEPNSELHRAMLRDAESFVKGITQERIARAVAFAGKKPSPPPDPLQTINGDLTPAGVEFLRRLPGWEDLSPEAIADRFRNSGVPLELVFKEDLRREWLPLTTPTEFVLMAPGGKEMELRTFVKRIAAAARRAGTKQKIDESVLAEPVDKFVERHPSLRAIRDALAKHPDPAVRAEWERFYWGTKLGRRLRAVKGERAGEWGFALGAIAKKRPDAIEVYLGQDYAAVIDATHRYGADIHNFKSRFYQLVLAEATGMSVEAFDYRSARRMRRL
jgi:hypothetical protein